VASHRHRQGPLELGSILLGPFALVPILQLASFVGHMQQFVANHGGAGSISNSISISIVTCHIDQYCVLRSYRSAISLWGGINTRKHFGHPAITDGSVEKIKVLTKLRQKQPLRKH